MKIWLTIKLIVACILGCTIVAGFRDVLGLEHGFFGIVQFIVNWVWFSSCWNFYYSREKNKRIKKEIEKIRKKKEEEDDDDIDFGDL